MQFIKNSGGFLVNGARIIGKTVNSNVGPPSQSYHLLRDISNIHIEKNSVFSQVEADMSDDLFFLKKTTAETKI
ncbi:MAG: hypothetical protein NZM38_01640 [Cytophagales bacterium]|nr:hypothetical protein [Cytophagales bacterium]MDW8383454.1 hypothetical protein [Flammeovirgaceae bacterium]